MENTPSLPQGAPYLDLSESQKRQYIDAETVFAAVLAARKAALDVRGSMVWKTVSGTEYLVRTSVRGAQKSLGPRTEHTESIYRNFTEKKLRATQRLKSLEQEWTQQQRLCRALRVGRVPNVVIDILQQLEKAGVGSHFLVIGTHALYAYESAAGVRIRESAMATRDVDLLFDTRQRLAFATTLAHNQESLVGILRKADPSFELLAQEKCTLRNSKGFEVDIVRRMAADKDPHPLRMSPDEDDLWPVQIAMGERLLSARRFDQMVVGVGGEAALMRTVHPLDFARTKIALSQLPGRDPLKAGKDALQAGIVRTLVHDLLPQLSEE